MEEFSRLSQLHLNDAARLREAGLFSEAESTLAETRELLRGLRILCGNQIWLLRREESQILAVAGYQWLDMKARRAALHLTTSSALLEKADIDEILKKGFDDLDVYRLEISLPSGQEKLAQLLQATGWREEGRLRLGVLRDGGQTHQDAILYGILRPDRIDRAVAFVLFSKGLYAISGGQAALYMADFMHFGQPIRCAEHREAAERLGLLDEGGAVLDREELRQRFLDKDYVCQPEPTELVSRAATQAAEYFSGKRQLFDLPLDSLRGSPFQVSVWRKLAAIPYGMTWTYEGLAHELENDWTRARKMARAVGAACSANPLPLILPCHRVIGKDGKLVGFSSGLDIKEYLLTHEIMGIIE